MHEDMPVYQGLTLPQRLFSLVLSEVFPERCPVCAGRADDYRTSPFCAQCFSAIRPLTGPCCERCARPLGSAYAAVCGECLKSEPPFYAAASYAAYRATMRDAIHYLKFHGRKRLARPLGRMLARLPVPPADCIVPVPVGSVGLRERGYNQSYLLARELGRLTGIAVDDDALYKHRETAPQVGLSARERRTNVRGSFTSRRRMDGELVVLLDDVITTGSTVAECSKILLKAGADAVFVVSLARA